MLSTNKKTTVYRRFFEYFYMRVSGGGREEGRAGDLGFRRDAKKKSGSMLVGGRIEGNRQVHDDVSM